MSRRALVAIALIFGAIAMTFVIPWTLPAIGRRFAALFQSAEYTHNLPRLLLARMAQQESNYDPRAYSSAGAQGIMQIVPRWHPGVDPYDPAAAIDYAGMLIRRHFDKFGTWRKSLAAYNAGPTRTAKTIAEHGSNWLANMPAETQKYVARIADDVRVV